MERSTSLIPIGSCIADNINNGVIILKIIVLMIVLLLVMNSCQ